MSDSRKATVDNFVLQAVSLHNRVSDLTKGYNQALSPDEQFKRWALIVSALNTFMRETSGRADTMAGLTSLTALLENIVTGKPSLADSYKKTGSQQLGYETQSHLALACAALDLLIRAGFEDGEAAQRVISSLRKSNLKMPKGSVEWKALLKWRNKLQYGEKEEALCELYRGYIAATAHLPAHDCEGEAKMLLNELPRAVGAA